MTDKMAHFDIDTGDVEYLRHGDKPLLARVCKPRGSGPFPLIKTVSFLPAARATLCHNSAGCDIASLDIH